MRGFTGAISRTAFGATALMVLFAGNPARAQYVCSTTPADITCTNTGISGTEFNPANGAGQNATTINSGTSGNIFTQTTGGGNSTTTNSGTVSGGIFSQANGAGNSTTTNSGTVTGGGIFTQALGSGSSTTTNSGSTDSIFTQAIGNGPSTTTNSGTVTSSGIFTQAIGNGPSTTINSGTVASGGIFTQAIGNGPSTTINSGTINGGVITQAIGGGTSSLVNSGFISNTGGPAIQFLGGPDTLTLLPGSFLIGAINLVGVNDTVNIRTGNLNLTFNTLAGATVTGTVPFAVSGNRIASIDPTSFATAGTALSDFARSVSAIIPDVGGMSAPGGAGVSAFASPDSASAIEDAFANLTGVSAYAADRMLFKNPTAVYADGFTVWGRGFGGRHVQSADGVLQRNVSTWYGGAIGLDRLVRPDLRLGVFVGGGATRNSIDPNNTVDLTDSTVGFGGAYARYTFGASFLNAALQGGSLRSTTARRINNNLLANGLETATAGYNGWYVSPELTLGHRFTLGQLAGSQYALTPSLQVRYLYAGFDGYTETGTTAPLTVGSRSTENVEERAELKLTRITQISPTAQIMFSLTGGALGVQRVGGNAINATLLAQPLAFTVPGTANVWGGFGGLGLEWQMRNVSVFAAAEYIAWQNTGSIVSGRGGVRIGF